MMNRLVVTLVLAVLVVEPVCADGILANGGFELPDQGGANAPQWRSDAGTVKPADETPFSGEWCGVVDHPRADVSTWVSHENVPVQPGLYVFSAAYRNPEDARILCQFNYYADENRKRAKLQAWGRPFRCREIATDDQWRRIQRIVRIYPGTNFVCVAFAVRGEPCRAWLDDVYLAPLSEARPGEIVNLALLGEGRSWDENTGQIVLQDPPHAATTGYWPWWDGLYAPAGACDGDDRTYWVSTAPGSDPPKDVGVQWPEPVTVGSVIVKYPNREVCPDATDVELQIWADESWQPAKLTSVAVDLDRAAYVYGVEPVSTERLRLYFSRFARERVSVQELEVYADPPEVEPADVVRNFHYERPTEPGPDRATRPKLLIWYQPKRGRSSAEPWHREYASAIDQDGEPVPLERRREHMRRRLAIEREAGVDGIMLNLGFNPLSPEILREQMQEDYAGTGISGVEHLRAARELGLDRSMPMLYLVAVLGDTWSRLGDGVKTLELANGRKFLDWRDDASWGLALETVRELARGAADAGCPGVAFDIEAYTTGIDVYIAENYPGADAAKLLEVARRRGVEMAEAINAEIPDAEIIWLGGYARDSYTLHNALFEGLTSVGGGGLHIATEGVYTTHEPERIKSVYDDAWQFGLRHTGDEDYWRERCGVAHGSWPSWPGAGRCLTPDQVRIQLRAFADQQPAPKYMWWYTGSSLAINDPEWAGYRAAYRSEEADNLMTMVQRLYDIYWDGFGAESTGLLYHTRINGPKGIGALSSPEEIAARTVRGKEMRWGYGSGIQDVALENGELLFALCDAYDATGEEWIAALARRAWRGLKTIGSVSPVAGFVPRGPHPDGKSYYPDSSRDQHAVYVYALWRYHKSPLATDEDRAFIVEFMDAFVRRMEAAEWSIYNEDNSAVAHVGFTWRQHALPGVISLMGTLSAIADATGNPEWIALLEQYADEGEGFRRKTLTPEGFSAWKGYNLYSDQYGLDFAAMSRILGESEHGDQVRGFMRAFAAGAMHSNVFDTDHWRRLDWAGQWSDEVTEEALAPFGLSLQTPATALELWPHFSAEHMRAPERATIAVNNKLCFGIPTVPMHLAMLSGDVELTAEAAPVVLEMIQVMLQHGAGYAGGENLNRSVIMGLYLIANGGGE